MLNNALSRSYWFVTAVAGTVFLGTVVATTAGWFAAGLLSRVINVLPQ